jgi:hypothetical protein
MDDDRSPLKRETGSTHGAELDAVDETVGGEDVGGDDKLVADFDPPFFL